VKPAVLGVLLLVHRLLPNGFNGELSSPQRRVRAIVRTRSAL
jgi:hypothetical protein